MTSCVGVDILQVCVCMDRKWESLCVCMYCLGLMASFVHRVTELKCSTTFTSICDDADRKLFTESHLANNLMPFLPARCYASAGNSDRNVSVRPSVRLSVRHAPVLCQNEES